MFDSQSTSTFPICMNCLKCRLSTSRKCDLPPRLAMTSSSISRYVLFSCLTLWMFTQIWRFQEDNSKFDAVKSTPLPLSQLQQSNFTFNPKESYLCLFIYQTGHSGKCFNPQLTLISHRTATWLRAKSAAQSPLSAPIVTKHAHRRKFDSHCVH